MENRTSQFKKGILELLIMSLIQNREMYGYQIIQELKKSSGEVFSLKEGTLYPVLYRLEAKEMARVRTEVERVDKRDRLRKYYLLTDKGREALKEGKVEFLSVIKAAFKILDDKF